MEFTDDEVKCLSSGIAAQSDELERLRAFARELLVDFRGIDFKARELLVLADTYGLTQESLKAAT